MWNLTLISVLAWHCHYFTCAVCNAPWAYSTPSSILRQLTGPAGNLPSYLNIKTWCGKARKQDCEGFVHGVHREFKSGLCTTKTVILFPQTFGLGEGQFLPTLQFTVGFHWRLRSSVPRQLSVTALWGQHMRPLSATVSESVSPPSLLNATWHNSKYPMTCPSAFKCRYCFQTVTYCWKHYWSVLILTRNCNLVLGIVFRLILITSVSHLIVFEFWFNFSRWMQSNFGKWND